MKVENQAYVSLEYKLSLDSGEVVDQSDPDQPLSFVVASGQIIPGLERQLMGMEVGQDAKITVEASEGYGNQRPELVVEIPRTNFPKEKEIKPGMSFVFQGPVGPMRFLVQSADQDKIMADFNHPMAGQRLHFEVKIREVRAATEEELKQNACAEESCGCCHKEGCK
jgi:FKBP-type peptidyl-prolyl cis-trans isomerase SlyD